MNNTNPILGSYPSDWEVVVFDSVAELKHGYQFRNYDFTKDGVKVFKITQIKSDGRVDISSCDFIDKNRLKDFQRFVIRKGDILMALSGATIGKIARYKSNEVVLQNYRVGSFLTKNPDLLNKDYLYYFLTTEYIKYQISSNQTQSAQENVGKEEIEKMLLLLPKIEEQERIAEVLSSLDDKIDLLHQQNKTLEALAETLFMQLLSNTDNNWKPQPFTEFIQDTFGGEWGKDVPTDDFNVCTSCIRGTDIADLQTGLPERTPIRYVKEKKLASILPKDGDIILEISGGTDDQSTGRTICIDKFNRTLFPHPLVFSNFCRLIRPKAKEYGYFLNAYLRYLYDQDEFFNMENGTSGIKNLDYKYLLFKQEYYLPITNKELLDYHDQVKDLHEKIGKNKLQISKLQQIRDTLLPKLMSGAIRANN